MQTENCKTSFFFKKRQKYFKKTAIHAYYSDKIIHNIIPEQKNN